jgi:predicted membrane protein (TIGR00267 family)
MKSARKVKRILLAREKSQSGNRLREVILGGQDGLVNVLGVVLGLSAVGSSNQVLIAASLAATFAESFSMGAVAYTSTLAEHDHYSREVDQELSEIENEPEKKKEEVRKIYRRKGFSGDLLEKVVSVLTRNKKVWHQTLTKEELGLAKVDKRAVLKSSIIVTLAAFCGSFIPVVPFLLFSRQTAIVLALAASGSALFAIGVYEAKTYVGSWLKNGLQMTGIGLGAALIGFLIGKFFKVN